MRTPLRLALLVCLLAGSAVPDASAGDCATCATKTVGSAKTVGGSSGSNRQTSSSSGGSCLMTWTIANRSGSSVNVEFESSSGEWPEHGYAWRMGPFEQRDFQLACRCGEQVEYGAWIPGSGMYWGSGEDNDLRCDDCVYTCRNTRVGIALQG